MKAQKIIVSLAFVACLALLIAASAFIYVSSRIDPHGQRVFFEVKTGDSFRVASLHSDGRLHVSIGKMRQMRAISDDFHVEGIFTVGSPNLYLLRIARHTEGGRLPNGEHVTDFVGFHVSFIGLASMSILALIGLVVFEPSRRELMSSGRTLLNAVDGLFGGKRKQVGFEPVIDERS